MVTRTLRSYGISNITRDVGRGREADPRQAPPLILTTEQEIESCLTGTAEEALRLPVPARPGTIELLPEEKKAA